MGCFQIGGTERDNCENGENERKDQLGSSPSEGDKELRSRSVCKKMIRELGSLFSWHKRETEEENEELLERNRKWLLTDIDCYDETIEVHSSVLTSTPTTVLMLTLEEGLKDKETDSSCRRLEHLERCISPASLTLIRFSYSEILAATRGLCKGRVLGRGALSCVYRGRFRFGRAVAIKRLDNENEECSKAFCRELLISSSLHNRNIVPLFGFCIDREGLFLVYKYVSGGSLEHRLHDRKNVGTNTLSWTTRYKIAIGIARAVAYLHNGTDKCVIHRDIKPSNILLSSRKTAKLCDFGLATWTAAPSVPYLCKAVQGTFGYLAPEYFQHGKVMDKTDIYALGVVFLELITGRRPIDARRKQGDENLILWARPLLQHGAIEELLDPRLRRGSYHLTQMKQMVRAAAACITMDEFARPNINQVIAILQGEEYQLDALAFAGNETKQQPKNDMEVHLALAMRETSDLEEYGMPHRYGSL